MKDLGIVSGVVGEGVGKIPGFGFWVQISGFGVEGGGTLVRSL